MQFKSLPRQLQVYIILKVLLLIPVFMLVWRQPQSHNGWVVTALLLFTVLFSTWKVELTVLTAKMTLSFAVVCLALQSEGVQVAMACAVLGAVLSSYLRPCSNGFKVETCRTPFHRALFNIANCALSCGCSAGIFTLVAAAAPKGDIGSIMALTAFTTFYFLFNTMGVSLAVAFQQKLNWTAVWQQNFLWTSPGYFASASAAAGIQVLMRTVGPWSLMFLPWLYVVYYSYRLYMERLHKDMAHIQELNKLNQAVIASLATAIDAKDRHTSSHINRVRHYAVSLAKAAGVTGPELDAVATGAVVHDIGKLGIPDHILLKPGKLSPDEFTRMQSHVLIGAEILSPVPFTFPVVDVVLTHHERWDGLGYPNGLRAEEIPIGGRIISLVDVFDALTSNRPYRRAMTCDEAAQVLREGSGKQFDPKLVETFLGILSRVWKETEEMEAEAAKNMPAASSVQKGSALIRISQAAAEMAAVCEVAHALAEKETMEEVLSVVVTRTLALLPGDTAIVYLQEGENNLLSAAAAEGKYKEKLAGMTVQVGEGMAGWVAENQKPMVNVSASLDVARRFSPEEVMELSASTAVPIVHGPDMIGVLAVYTQGYSILTEHHLHVLNIIAEHAASAIQHIRRVEKHQEMAFADPLTGLANSRCLVRHLDRIAQFDRNGRPFSLVMLDLDRFKEVNDTLGHLQGDELLREVSRRLLEVARAEDIVCRYAGDEFVLLLPGVVRDNAGQ
jgi:putative nucleotidyltransferase with HDIG domain